MRTRFLAGLVRPCSFVVLSMVAAAASAQSPANTADALLAIDQSRASVVERIVDTWGPTLAKSREYVSIDDLRTRLMSLRADRLLAASLAGTEEGLREVTGFAISPSSTLATPTKALGDTSIDVVYTPVTPCRLVDTRGTFAAVYQGNGTPAHTADAFASNEIRSYAVQGGNGVCVSQLPAGFKPAAVQLQVFGIPTTSASGDIEILPQGSTFGSTATMVYVGTIAFNTVSTAARINPANNEISVQVRGGGANLAMDVVGYFAAPSGNGGKFFRQGGNAFGTATTLGTTDNQPFSILVDNQPTFRLAAVSDMDDASTVNVINGSPLNAADAGAVSVTISGGGAEVTGTAFGQHVTGSYGTVGGGFGNVAGVKGTVAGGTANTANGGLSSVAGGDSNTASGAGAAISGGVVNVASGFWSAVGGGLLNTASGDESTVPGGSNNEASAEFSFAAGHRAKATTTGSFIWADSREFDFQPSVPNFFGVRATGGVGFTVAIDGTTGAVTQFCNLLPGTPSWQCTSDRNAKENFVPVDSMDVLARVVAMPISTWNFKGADPSLRAIGPTAQDFYAAFHLGNDDKSIATSNLAGVALAAIQGLYQTMRRKDEQIAAQGQVVARLTGEVASMRAELDRAMRALARNGTLR